MNNKLENTSKIIEFHFSIIHIQLTQKCNFALDFQPTND